MGSWVHGAVRALIVRQVEIVGAAPERELKNGHARQTGGFTERNNGWHQLAEIFRDQLSVGQNGFDGLEKRKARALFPTTRAGGRGGGRNGPVRVERAEVIDAHDVVEREI